MPNTYLQQTSTLSAVLPGVIPEQAQQRNQFSSIITDITNLYHAVNGLLGNGSTGSSWFQSQNDVTGLRAIGNIYTNTSGKTILVTITLNISSASSATIFSDTTLNPQNEVGATNIISTLSPVTFMVLNNNSYTVTKSGTVSIVKWIEWS